MLFLLTSCPIKASIKQNLVGDAPIEQQEAAKNAVTMVFDDAECFVASSEDLLLLSPVQVDLQMQPFVMLLSFVALFLPFLLDDRTTTYVTNTKTPFVKGILLLISRLNL